MENDIFEFVKASGILIGILIVCYLLPKLFEALGWRHDKIYPNSCYGIPRFENPPPPPPRPKSQKSFDEYQSVMAKLKKELDTPSTSSEPKRRILDHEKVNEIIRLGTLLMIINEVREDDSFTFHNCQITEEINYLKRSLHNSIGECFKNL